MRYTSARKKTASISSTKLGCAILVTESGGVKGVKVRHQGRELEIRAGAVVLACGGFEANAEWRTKYLGPGWDLAKVRGSRFNTGDGLAMALNLGAQPFGTLVRAVTRRHGNEMPPTSAILR